MSVQQKAWRAARRVGLIARKSCLGGFMLLDERDGIVVGARFDLTPKDVIDFCSAPFNHGRWAPDGSTLFEIWKWTGEPLPRRQSHGG